MWIDHVYLGPEEPFNRCNRFELDPFNGMKILLKKGQRKLSSLHLSVAVLRGQCAQNS